MINFRLEPMLRFLPSWSPVKWYLFGANVALGVVLVVLSHTSVFPLGLENFLFFFFVSILFALYRPGWAFLFFIGLLPFETVNLAPEALGFNLRPYQWAALSLMVALVIRGLVRKLPFRVVTLRWFDMLLFLIPLGAFFSLIAAPDPLQSAKQAVVVSSFFLVYLLCRQYLQTVDDIRQTLPFFFGSALVVLGYALWQSVRTQAGEMAWTAMAGRPNSTFSEADWLGMFVVFVIVILWSIGLHKANLLSFTNRKEFLRYLTSSPWPLLFFAIHMAALVVLILAVSRSAWLGFAAAFLLAMAIVAGTPPSVSRYNRNLAASGLLGFMGVALACALAVVVFGGLTSFALFDRAESTGTGLQKITVACQNQLPPERITHTDELARYGCEHILLEEQGALAAQGLVIGETYRPDPNIEERKRIYNQSIGMIGEHPLFGIGWGSMGTVLGPDGRGAALNASNIFLETWLGSGLMGLGALLVFLGTLLWGSARALLAPFGTDPERRTLSFFFIVATVGLSVFNLFNSGILLGFFFLYLALGASTLAYISVEKKS